MLCFWSPVLLVGVDLPLDLSLLHLPKFATTVFVLKTHLLPGLNLLNIKALAELISELFAPIEYGDRAPLQELSSRIVVHFGGSGAHDE